MRKIKFLISFRFVIFAPALLQVVLIDSERGYERGQAIPPGLFRTMCFRSLRGVPLKLPQSVYALRIL